MAANDTENMVMGRLDFPKIDGLPSDQNNILFGFTNTDENVDAFKDAVAALTLDGWFIKDLTPRNRYGRQGKPLHLKIAEAKAEFENLLKMQAELEALEAADADVAKTEDSKPVKK